MNNTSQNQFQTHPFLVCIPAQRLGSEYYYSEHLMLDLYLSRGFPQNFSTNTKK